MDSKLNKDCFCNVDLDIFSSSDLQPLVSALGNRVIDLFVGKVRQTYEAHLELNWSLHKNPSLIIVRFCRLIESLLRRQP